MALWTRARAGQDVAGVVHHSDAGAQLNPPSRRRSATATGSPRRGRRVDRHRRRQLRHSVHAESLIGLYKTECVRRDGPVRGVDDLELATCSWVAWFNETRLHGSIGHVPAAEHEANYYRHTDPRQQPLPGQPTRY